MSKNQQNSKKSTNAPTKPKNYQGSMNKTFSTEKWLKDHGIKPNPQGGDQDRGTRKLLPTLRKKIIKRLMRTDGQRPNWRDINCARLTLINLVTPRQDSKNSNGPFWRFLQSVRTCESTRQLSASTWRGSSNSRTPYDSLDAGEW